MSDIEFDLDGMLDFTDELGQYFEVAENSLEELDEIAEEFTKDLMKLTRPRSSIGGHHTHLVSSFSHRQTSRDVEVGWGVYYGPFVEHGTRKMKAQSHLEPTWERNVNRYINDFKKKYNLDD